MTTLSNTVISYPVPTSDRALRTGRAAIPDLLRCAVVSWHAERCEHIRRAAECEAWVALVCEDEREAMQCAFRENLPLAIVDLPLAEASRYPDFRELARRLCEVGKSDGTGDMLLVVCTSAESVQEEIWARQLGVWSYLPFDKLPTANDGQGMALIFREARKAVAKRAAAMRELAGNRFGKVP